jgi:hypothetical protein
MIFKRKSRRLRWKAQLEMLVQALTILEKIKTLVAPMLMLLLRKVKPKILFTVFMAVINISELYFEQ